MIQAGREYCAYCRDYQPHVVVSPRGKKPRLLCSICKTEKKS